MYGNTVVSVSIFHYHLLPGGVTGVIEQGIRALRTSLAGRYRIRLICGREEHTAALLQHLNSTAASENPPVELQIVPEIDYLHDTAEPEKTASVIRRFLEDECLDKGGIWWIHNYHIGKNPLFTDEVLRFARLHPEQRILFHIHDFPECARYENLAFLERFVSRPLYPQLPNLRYLVLNDRDKAYLEHAGCSPALITLLRNPIDSEIQGGFPALSTGEQERLRQKIKSAAADRFPGYHPDAPWILYPIRSIRRKNVLEAGFLCRLSEKPLNLIVTLPGTSRQEVTYSNLVERCFIEGRIPGLWGVGKKIDELAVSFNQLVAVSDAVISSSVQEGFGYQFINPLIWGKPLCARYLDILDGIQPVFEGFPHFFYTALRVPFSSPSLTNIRRYIETRYREKITALSGRIPESALRHLSEQAGELISGESIDFSFLSVELQYTFLKDLSEEPFRSRLAGMNKDLLLNLSRVFASAPAAAEADRIKPFSPRRYAEEFQSIAASFEGKTPQNLPASSREIHGNLLELFSKIEYIRLLYENLGTASSAGT
jgi:hypothetical protein